VAIASQQITLTTSPAVVIAEAEFDTEILLESDSTIWIGGASVSNTTGLNINSADPPTRIKLNAGDVLYGIAASGSATARVLFNTN
jgi:hypothetical protein